jgi:hypothetical protein
MTTNCQEQEPVTQPSTPARYRDRDIAFANAGGV